MGLTSDGLMEREHFEMENDVRIEKHYALLNVGFDLFMKAKCQTFNCYIPWWTKSTK